MKLNTNIDSHIISPKVNWAVFDEGPSDGFKIGLSVWGMVRANENPTSKNVHQFFSKRATLKSCKFHPFWIQLKYMKLNWSFDSQKKNTAYFSFFFLDIYSSNQSIRNSLQCFFETLMIEYAQKSLGHSIQQNPRVDFLWTESTAKTRCFFYIIMKNKKIERRSWVIWCVFFFANGVLCLLACLAVFFFRANFGSCILNACIKWCFLKHWRKAHFCRLRWGKFPDMKLKIGKFHADFRFYHIYR